MRDGRSLNWELLVGELCYATWSNVFNDEIDDVLLCGEQVFTVKRRPLIPFQINAGAYTVERIVGFIEYVWDLDFLDLGAQGTDLFRVPVATAVVLTPRTSLATFPAAVIHPRDAADLESNRFMWIDYATPQEIWPANILGAGASTSAQISWRREVDIRVRRRVDRENWQLDLVSVAHGSFNDSPGFNNGLRCNVVLRGLLRTYESL